MSDLIPIVHVITRLELGGAQINTVFTVEHLDGRRFRAFLVSGPGGMLQPETLDAGAWHIVHSLGRPIRPIRDLRAFFALRRILKALRPRIVHTHSSKAGIIGRLAARSLKVEAIVHTVHGFSFSPHQGMVKRLFFRWAEKWVSGLTRHFVFVSEADFSEARRLKLVGENGSVIRSGFPLGPFLAPSQGKNALREEFGIPDHAVVCGVVAPFKPQKGLFHLIDIARRVVEKDRRVVFFLAGDGSERPKIERELRRLEILPHFRLPGFIRGLGRVMDLFDIGVSTALWEGLPQSLVQMRLKKIPLVVSDIPGNREVACDGQNGYVVDIRRPDLFAGAILRLAADSGLRQRLGDHPSEDLSEWDADVMVKKQEALYLDLLAKAKR